ncbi:MAG: periplasmic protein TonB [Blastocatellia bacterium]|jgi:protein TonB|nr:periplasmic protein TonB [Blastocatellia bacterium]
MFTNLIESDSHRKEFKRRSSFFLATVAAYALILSAAGVASIFAYDAHLEAQTNDLVLLNWIPPVKPVTEHDRPQPARRAPASSNTSRVSSQPVRPVSYESASNPLKVPDHISGDANPIPPAPPNTRIGNYVGDPVSPPGSSTCMTCIGTGTDSGPVVKVDDATPPPAPVVIKPPSTTRLTSSVLISKAISLPQPLYPPLAKQIKAQGAVNVQILVDEQGRVVSAQAVSGNPTLLVAAKDAAMRARFTPTILSGVPVKVQGLITYNFVLQ